MIATMMLLPDYTVPCNHCGTPAWGSDTREISRTENEWECRSCRRMAYWEYLSD